MRVVLTPDIQGSMAEACIVAADSTAAAFMVAVDSTVVAASMVEAVSTAEVMGVDTDNR